MKRIPNLLMWLKPIEAYSTHLCKLRHPLQRKPAVTRFVQNTFKNISITNHISKQYTITFVNYFGQVAQHAKYL